jgi:hypothetical protein
MANIITAGNSTNGGTAISTDTSGTLNIVTGSGSGANAITIDASQVVTIPGNLTVSGTLTAKAVSGSVVQVVSTTNTSFFTTTSASFTDITGVSVSITPTSATNKILVLCNVPYGASVDAVIRLVRNSTAVGNGTAGSTNGINAIYSGGDGQYSAYQSAFNFLDSPATTSATTYKIQILATGGGTAFVNRRRQDTTYGCQSTITVMEIAA